MTRATSYSSTRTIDCTFDDALTRTRAALADEGFGVLFEIDVQATLDARLGGSREPYVILGACNPQLADRALAVEPQLGVLLPCNLVVAVEDGATVVSAVAADALLGMMGNPALEQIAHEVADRLARVLRSLDR